MPINFPGFQPGQVPTMRPVQPMQNPGMFDPAQIIMHAAALKQQKNLEEQKIQQRNVEDLMTSMRGAQQLQEQKREAESRENIAQQTLDIAQGKVPLEQAQMEAQTKLLEAQGKLAENQANMMGNPGTLDTFNQIHNGQIPPSMGFSGFSSKNGVKGAMMNMYAKMYPNDNIGMLEANYQKLESAARTAGGTSVQIPTAMAKGVASLTSDLADRGEKIGLTQFPTINKGILAAKTAIGDPDTRDYILRNVEARKQLAQVFSAGGAPTDFAAKSADEALAPETGPAAMRMINESTIPSMINARVGSLAQIGPQGPQSATQSTTNAPANPALPQTQQQAGAKIRVRRKSDGQVGMISQQYMNPSLYDPL